VIYIQKDNLLFVVLFLEKYIYQVTTTHSTGLTLRQNKHVLRASRDKGAPQKSRQKANYFISQILGSKTH
jgi:hypothetical protein